MFCRFFKIIVSIYSFILLGFLISIPGHTETYSRFLGLCTIWGTQQTVMSPEQRLSHEIGLEKLVVYADSTRSRVYEEVTLKTDPSRRLPDDLRKRLEASMELVMSPFGLNNISDHYVQGSVPLAWQDIVALLNYFGVHANYDWQDAHFARFYESIYYDQSSYLRRTARVPYDPFNDNFDDDVLFPNNVFSLSSKVITSSYQVHFGPDLYEGSSFHIRWSCELSRAY